MADTGTIMALMRGLHLAASLSLLGTTGFIAWMLPAAAAPRDALRSRLIGLWWISGLLALLAGLAWFTLQSGVIADARTIAEALDAVPLVATHTRYGNMLMMRLGLLSIATVLAFGAARSDDAGAPFTGSVHLALILTAAALGLQGFIGHAGATAGTIGDSLVLFEALHLLAAGLWLGALLPLWISLRTLAPAQAAGVCEHFSPIGLACVLVLAGTGCAQGLALMGGVGSLFDTRYGRIALLKIALFLLALGLAAANRLWLTDRLAAGAAGARRHLALSIGIETMIGLTIVMAAAFLAASSPGAHQAPAWPFSWRFSLLAANEDPYVRRQAAFSLMVVGMAAAMLAAALMARRFRKLTTAVLAMASIWRGPSLLPTRTQPAREGLPDDRRSLRVHPIEQRSGAPHEHHL